VVRWGRCFDLALPVGVGELPEDLAALDALLGDRDVLGAIERAWDRARAITVDDREGDLRAFDGDQAAHRVGL
jgi:hypothetical protein